MENGIWSLRCRRFVQIEISIKAAWNERKVKGAEQAGNKLKGSESTYQFDGWLAMKSFFGGKVKKGLLNEWLNRRNICNGLWVDK